MALESPCRPGTDAGEPDVGAVGLLVVDGPVVCGVFRGEGTGRVVVEPVAVVERLVAKPLAGAPEVVVLAAGTGASTVRSGSPACPTAAGGLSAAAVTAPDAGPGGLFGLESGGVACGGDIAQGHVYRAATRAGSADLLGRLRSATAGASPAPGPRSGQLQEPLPRRPQQPSPGRHRSRRRWRSRLRDCLDAQRTPLPQNCRHRRRGRR